MGGPPTRSIAKLLGSSLFQFPNVSRAATIVELEVSWMWFFRPFAGSLLTVMTNVPSSLISRSSAVRIDDVVPANPSSTLKVVSAGLPFALLLVKRPVITYCDVALTGMKR